MGSEFPGTAGDSGSGLPGGTAESHESPGKSVCSCKARQVHETGAHPARRRRAEAHGISKERISSGIRISVCMPRQSRKNTYYYTTDPPRLPRGEKMPLAGGGGQSGFASVFWVAFSERQTGGDPGRNARHSPAAIPSMPSRAFTKAALQRSAMAIPEIRTIRRSLLFIFQFRISASAIKVPRFPGASPSAPAGAEGRRGPGRGEASE